jgi:hypothetical protein
MSISQKEEFLKENPHVKQSLACPAIGDSVRLGIRKVDSAFNDVLQKAKQAHAGSTVKLQK